MSQGKTISRRGFLRTSACLTAGTLLSSVGCGDDGLPALPSDLPEFQPSAGSADLFRHGVASGDPTSDGVVLWTTLTAPATPSIDVFYEVALDEAFTRRVAAGTVTTDESVDHTVHLELEGLVWGRDYHYRFRAESSESPTGRTRLAPLASSNTRLRFGVASCSNYARGRFHAYRHLAERDDLDAVLHLGDFIYEGGTSASMPRQVEPPHTCVTLADYRTRHAHYRTDPDLQEMLRRHPIISVWDDHETANNAYADGAPGHNEATLGPWADREDAGRQAYAEWLPVRSVDPLYRRFQYGAVAELVMLDTRLERDPQIANLLDDTPDRSLLGDEQEAWLEATLANGDARWVVIGQQVMVAPLDLPVSNDDQWDGYASARQRFLQSIQTHADQRTIVLTGDIHSAWANVLARPGVDPFDEGYDRVGDNTAVEFVAPGITSPFPLPFSIARAVGPGVPLTHPHVYRADMTVNGFFVLELGRSDAHADWFVVDGLEDGDGALSFLMGFSVDRGRATLVERDEPR